METEVRDTMSPSGRNGVVPVQPIPTFDGIEIRAIPKDGEIWIPHVDIADAWCVDRSTPDNIINRNKEAFDGLSTSVFDVTSNTEFRCLNERGLYLMMGKISANRVKDPAAKDRIIKFQRWYPTLIQQYRKGVIPDQTPVILKRSLEQNADVADLLVERFKWSREQANNFAFDQVKKETGVSIALPQPSVLSHSDPAENWMSPTDLGKECGLTGEQVNGWLYNNKLQYPTYEGTRKIWRLTDTGEPYGEEFVMEFSNKHSEIRIRWRPSVKEFAPGIRKVQPIVADAMGSGGSNP